MVVTLNPHIAGVIIATDQSEGGERYCHLMAIICDSPICAFTDTTMNKRFHRGIIVIAALTPNFVGIGSRGDGVMISGGDIAGGLHNWTD